MNLDLPDDFNTDKELTDVLRKKQLLVNVLYKEENRHIWEFVAKMHINYYNGGYKDWSCHKTLHIGVGQIDFDQFLRFVKKMGIEEVTIESNSFDKAKVIDLEWINGSICNLQGILNEKLILYFL